LPDSIVQPLPRGDPLILVGVIADTHIPDRAPRLPVQILEFFQNAGVQQILHAGDISIPSVLEELNQIAPVTAVRGNRDWLFRKTLPWKTTLDLAGIQLGMAHGHGGLRSYVLDKFQYISSGYQFKRYYHLLARTFPEARIIVYGHTHRPENRWENGQLIFNPGSACCPSDPGQAPSLGLLHIYPQQQVRAEIIPI
jgi:putative phosphoesterase